MAERGAAAGQFRVFVGNVLLGFDIPASALEEVVRYCVRQCGHRQRCNSDALELLFNLLASYCCRDVLGLMSALLVVLVLMLDRCCLAGWDWLR